MRGSAANDGLLEIVWALGLKASDGFTRWLPSVVVVVAAAASFWLLALAMRVLPAGFVSKFSPRLINTHPALLPLFPGAHAVRDTLAAGVTETGLTVHVIDEGVDTGPALRQACVAIAHGESEDELHERIKQLEKYRVTTFCAPPTIYRFLIKEDFSKYDFSAMQHCTIAGEALNPEV